MSKYQTETGEYIELEWEDRPLFLVVAGHVSPEEAHAATFKALTDYFGAEDEAAYDMEDRKPWVPGWGRWEKAEEPGEFEELFYVYRKQVPDSFAVTVAFDSGASFRDDAR